MVIAISGKSGCGNSSVSKRLAKQHAYTLINYTFRNYARDHGLRLADIHAQARKNRAIDYYIDNRQVELAQAGDCVVGSRLAIWKIQQPDLRIYLTAPLWVRAKRIAQREQRSYLRTLVTTGIRDIRNWLRYKRYYRININRYQFADLIIDTVANSIDDIIAIISRAIDSQPPHGR